MKELSLNILDISENSTKAGATRVGISIVECDERLKIEIKDNGHGMTPEILDSVTNPFCTTRTTRKVGMGIPLFKFAAEQTGGGIEIKSKHINDFPDDHGTVVTALFYKTHIDCTPLGDVISTVVTLIQGHPTIDILFTHKMPDREITLDTKEIRAILENVPLDTFEVLQWIRENLADQYASK
jgi:hypothetical protein